MKTKLLDLIVCPECKRRLSLVIIEEKDNEIKEGALKCPCSKEYKITNFIPRFVDNDKYVDSFSFEWQVHSKTQLDSANTDHISEDTFQARIDFSLEDLKEKLVLDAGCGCGRFSEVAAKYGATVVGFDLSFAVDVAFKNIGLKPNVHLIQADIYHLPFHPNTFDLIFSFGVLHHTPDCKRAFKQLPQFLKSKGRISL
ncbi:MAG: methyltransferase domain-containing protein, partial [Candidatus Omnitrophica bacterium]|nr:methyltransferase domain-containing protein [Candidatus Omnitrophota bacterium]MBU1922899.1 methyltransferase domain-containing protein [Candidatus Omnitrophota bacterium]